MSGRSPLLARSEWFRAGRGMGFQLDVTPAGAGDWLEGVFGDDGPHITLVGRESRKISRLDYEWVRRLRPFSDVRAILSEAAVGERWGQFALCDDRLTILPAGDSGEDILPELGLGGCPILQWIGYENTDARRLDASHLPRVQNMAGIVEVRNEEYTLLFKRMKAAAKKAGLLAA
ncbi:MAG: hypothetical protein ACM30G_16460 [Micromonosporaceae bacterium]